MVSPRKGATSVGVAERPTSKLMATSAKSCESLFSNSSKESASLIYQRKLPLPQAQSACKRGSAVTGRVPSLVIPGNNAIQQRVMSARNLRIKTFQNQIADLQHEIASLAHENRMLRTLHKRQDNALAKYEAQSADLPKLLHSHSEELRVWQTKSRNLQALNKELELKIKQKEAHILSLSDQNKHYNQLNKDKNLDERKRLQEKVKQLEQRLVEKDNELTLLARKVQLESKNYKHKLLNEQKKTREMMLKFEKSKLKMSGYRKLEELAAEGNLGKVNVDGDIEEDGENLGKSIESLEKAMEKNNLFTNFENDDDFELAKSTSSGESKTLRNLRKPSISKGVPLSHKSNKSLMKNMALPKSSMRLQSGANSNNKIGLNRKDNINELQKFTQDLKSAGNTIGKKSFIQNVDQNSDRSTEDENVNLTEEFANDEDDDSVERDNHVSLSAYAAYIDNCEDVEFDEMRDLNELEADNDDYDDEDDNEEKNSIMVNPKGRTTADMREDITTIRKQITHEFKEREAFLDTFCRQASSNSMQSVNTSKKRGNMPSGGSHITGNRKNALLASLRAIDNNKSQD